MIKNSLETKTSDIRDRNNHKELIRDKNIRYSGQK